MLCMWKCQCLCSRVCQCQRRKLIKRYLHLPSPMCHWSKVERIRMEPRRLETNDPTKVTGWLGGTKVQPYRQKNLISHSVNDQTLISVEDQSQIKISWHRKEKSSKKIETSLFKIQIWKTIQKYLLSSFEWRIKKWQKCQVIPNPK